jgi:hypothetical protein
MKNRNFYLPQSHNGEYMVYRKESFEQLNQANSIIEKHDNFVAQRSVTSKMSEE